MLSHATTRATVTPAGKLNYVVLTAARNEVALLGQTLDSMVTQTLRPLLWIIVSDGSTDGTDQLVQRYAGQHAWISLMRMPERRERSFAAKADCVNAAYRAVAALDFDVVVNVDADISFAPDFFEYLLQQFAASPGLGVAGTPYTEQDSGGKWILSTHTYSNLNHVSGQCQAFRRKCFDEIGGYLPIKGGAVDWVAVTTARMRKWETRSFPARTFHHHRTMGTAEKGVLHARFHYGRKAYYVGGHPVWELLRGFFQMASRPWIIGGLCFQWGFLWAWMSRMPRLVSPELIAFHQSEQLKRLTKIFRRFGGRSHSSQAFRQ